MTDFLQQAEELFPYTQALRRDLHMHPELGFREVRTGGIVAKELEALGIEVEIVPGITTALAAAAATKQPLTRRGVARSVAFFTSSTAPDEPDHPALPETDTLVQYMGGREAAATAARLLAEGRRPDLPVVVVENCSRADQRILRLTLDGLANGLDAAQGPVLVMIGEALQQRPHQAS